MPNNKKQVMINLQTIINDQGQVETIRTQEKGVLVQRPMRDVLLYEEVADDGGQINNLITLQADRVSIKRSGLISMHQQFVVNQLSETMYEHPHGTFHLETFTKRINYETAQEQISGRLDIDYTVSLNGQEERQHKLVLTYQEED